MTWADTSWFWALWGVVLLAGLMLWGARRHVVRLGSLFRGAALDRVLPPRVRTRRALRDALWLAGLVVLIVALAEPRFGKRKHMVDSEGVDLILAVDLSRSMDANDVDPSRLERARREILDLTGQLAGSRLGLVIFAGGAYPRMPLTADRKALEMVVRDLDTATFQAQGSNLGAALREGVKLLSKGTNDAGRAILVLSDGEVHEPGDALTAAQEASAAGVVVFGMVIGQAPAPIPNGDGTFLKDPATGDRVTSTPTDAVLSDIARATGGAVVRSVPGDEDTRALVSEMGSSLQSAVRRSEQLESFESAVGWPLGLGVLLLLAGAWLGDGRRVIATVMLALLVLSPAAHAQEPAAAGDSAYRAGRYADAVRIFEQLATEQPDDADLQGRLGAARYRAGDFTGAARAFDRQSQLSGDADAAYNAGNAWWQSGVLDRALQRYDAALARDPANEGAKTNRDLVQKEIQERRAEQQQQKQQAGEGEQGKPGEQPPQQGQQDPSQGKPGDGSSDPQDAKPGDGDTQGQSKPSTGQPNQAPKPGDPSQGKPTGEPGKEPGQDGGEPQDDGTRSGEGDAQGAKPDPNQAGEAGDEATTGGGGGAGDDSSPQGMTPDQAKRLLDGVEEGRPRVVVPGQATDKPW